MKQKKVYFEFIRIIACSLVLFNHTTGYHLYSMTSGAKQYLYMCLAMVTKINVPLFFMISGAVLLDREESIVTVFKRRVFRIFLIIALVEGILFLTNIDKEMVGEGENFLSVLENYIRGLLNFDFKANSDYAYWYLYAYLGFLCVLPLVQRIANGMKLHEFIMLLIMRFIMISFMPLLNFFLTKLNIESFSISSLVFLPFVQSDPFFYTLIGYYIEHKIDIKKINLKTISLIICLAIMGIILSNYCTLSEGIATGTYTENYVTLFNYLIAIVFFIIIKYIFVNKRSMSINKISEKIICYCGSLTFGIYLMDPILKIYIWPEFMTRVATYPIIIVSIMWIAISLIIGGAITSMLKQIPLIKKFI